MKKIIPLLCFLFLININLYSQNIKIPFQALIKNSSLVVEGKVVDSECFISKNGSIFTSHKIKVYKSFNSEIQSHYIFIITNGGSVGSIVENVSHTLYLSPGQAGIFFLYNYNELTGKYKVFADEQGFLEYIKREDGFYATNLFHSYKDIGNSLFKLFEKEYGMTPVVYFESEWDYSYVKPNKEDEYSAMVKNGDNCFEFHFEVSSPDPTNLLMVFTVVSIRST